MDLTLNFEQKSLGGSTLRHIRVEGPHLPRILSSEGYFFELAGQNNAPSPRVLDGFMFIFLQYAMEHVHRYVVRGPLSARCMRNAQIFQEAWHKWLPDRFKPVEIIPETILEEKEFHYSKNSRAICAFSGGVDATFLALRHGRREFGASSYNLDTVVTVHGYDFPLDNVEAFNGLLRRTDSLLKNLGLERRILRTNIRSFQVQNWEFTYGAHIACAMHQYSQDFEYGLIGSSAPYDSMINAWGSSPATDYLLSGDDLEIVHDGAGYSRTEKIQYLLKTPDAIPGLNVCWEGQQESGNCGACEKCLRTRLNFLAAGCPEPDCFPGPFDLRSIESVRPSKFFLLELSVLLEHARKNKIDAPWVSVVQERIRQSETGV